MRFTLDVRERFWKMAGLLAACSMLGGCDAVRHLTNEDLIWIWLLVPLAMFAAAGATFVWQIRSGQLANWRIDEDPVGPGIRPLVVGVAVTAVILAILFVVVNVLYAGGQALINSGLWVLGSVGGGAVALLGGLRLAEARKKAN